MEKTIIILATALILVGLMGSANAFYLERVLEVVVTYNTTLCDCSTIWVEIDDHGRENCTGSCEYDLEEFINCSWVNLSDSLYNCTASLESATEQLDECQHDVLNNLSYLDVLIQERCTASEIIQLNLEDAVEEYKRKVAEYWNDTYLPARAEYDALSNELDTTTKELRDCRANNLELNETLGERNNTIRGLQGENNLEFWAIIFIISVWLFSKYWGRRAEFFGKVKKPKKHKKPPVPSSQSKSSFPSSKSDSSSLASSSKTKVKKKRRGLIGRLI